MGKYMRKSKTDGDVAVMEVAQSSLGVRTRAKTLALQRLQQSGGSYLQLRSRKLEKPPFPVSVHESRRQRPSGVRNGGGVQNPSPNCKTRGSSRLRVWSKLVVGNQREEKVEEPENDKLKDEVEIGQIGDDGVGEGDANFEAFTGENSLNFHGNDRSTRESTPCSFIRDPDHVGTPGSATKTSVETSKRMQNSAQRLMPTTQELEDFFAGAEQQQHRQFMEKYNFDPVYEKPLPAPGRYDWNKINP